MVIVLDAGWIEDMSMGKYTIGTPGTIDTTRYTRFLTVISDTSYGRLAQDGLLNSDGSLKTGAEPLAALLVCDMIQSGSVSELGIMSENFGGDYSYTKSAVVARETKSAYMAKYEAILDTKNKGKSASSGVERADKNIEFAKLSQGPYPQIDSDSAGL